MRGKVARSAGWGELYATFILANQNFTHTFVQKIVLWRRVYERGRTPAYQEYLGGQEPESQVAPSPFR